MIRADTFREALKGAGFTVYSGVPCSLLEPLLSAVFIDADLKYVSAASEGEAVAVAAGAWLGGTAGAVLMQNSGLGNAVNPLASLIVPYDIPVLLIISWRGEPGTDDAAHHLPMGRATLPILQALQIAAAVVRTDADVAEAVRLASVAIATRRRPFAIVVPSGALERSAPPPGTNRDARSQPLVRTFGGMTPPSRPDAVSLILDRIAGPIVSTTGYISRDVGQQAAPGRAFLMQGSMGCAAAIGLGVTTACGGDVTVIDGDGALIMRLGTLAMVGGARPPGFLHVVLDDGLYASAGRVPSLSSSIDFAAAAAACGYASACSCAAGDQLAEALDWAQSMRAHGPVLLHARISAHEVARQARPDAPPRAVADAFRSQLPGPTASAA